MELVLQHATLVNGRTIDIVIANGIIVELAAAGQGKAETSIDCSGLYVSSGWIDLHVHAMAELAPYGDDIDEIGIKQGVTTIVDAGSCGADRIDALQERAAIAKTRVLSFLNISHIGLERVDELSRLAWLDEQRLAAALNRHKDFIIGLKARISRSVVKELGLEPLTIARKWSKRYGLPLMVHIGSGPPNITDVIGQLQRDDIVTHFLNGKANNLFTESGQPIEALLAAIARGVRLDVGHGTASFSFETAEKAKAAGIHPDTISTDIYRNNRMNGPVYSLADTMSKFLLLGYSLQQVVMMVTEHAAAILSRPELGSISIGGAADITLFELRQEAKRLVDSEGQERLAEQHIKVRGVVRDGTYNAC
ncbi:amidohydrolase/deacetylase family metallohydrolase [Paenibacillus sp. FSL W7-1287]|uniref:amidohydrolase/deacetylase family metallohydrolase n=1 Tax=Paenibacillus sp. FSL W7-1287 TaxID=2954538 RepID=UPI0030F91392